MRVRILNAALVFYLLLSFPRGSPKVPGVIPDQFAAEYRCPGENYSISRAVHLGRLASFHSACRECPERDDTDGLSTRQIRKLTEVGSRTQRRPLFHAEGAGNVSIDDLNPDVARRIAIEFARQIAPDPLPNCQRHDDSDMLATCPTQNGSKQPSLLVANDGRMATAAIIAAIVEGFRWTGCETIDIGRTTAPCAVNAIQHLAASGGIFVGNSGDAAHAVGLKFWAGDEPLSRGGMFDRIEASLQNGSFETMIDRPLRTFGRLRRISATESYHSDLRPAYHALRPLRFVLDCTLGPEISYLEELTRNLACRVIPCERAGRLGLQVAATQAHFGIRINDDGENCRVVDERGRAVPAERLLACVAGGLTGPIMHGGELRQQTFLRMRESRAEIGVDPAGRLWYASGHSPVPDALRTLTLLLVLLSCNDRAFSAVLDQELPAV